MTLGPPTPDLAGFGKAQAELRTFFGRDVRFYGPDAILYDPTLPPGDFDDEGFPLDPLITGSAIASANVGIANLAYLGSAHCNVVFQALSTTILRRDEVSRDQMSLRSRQNKDLIMDINDLPVASGASHFQVGTATRDAAGTELSWVADETELWKIVNARADGLGALQRYVVYGESTR